MVAVIFTVPAFFAVSLPSASTDTTLLFELLQTVKIPSGYTTIETQAFQNQTDLYQIEIPASVKTIGIDAFAGCNKARLTIVTPYGSAAETYAKANEIHYSSQTSLPSTNLSESAGQDSFRC